jgi:hypothetical protein
MFVLSFLCLFFLLENQHLAISDMKLHFFTETILEEIRNATSLNKKYTRIFRKFREVAFLILFNDCNFIIPLSAIYNKTNHNPLVEDTYHRNFGCKTES